MLVFSTYISKIYRYLLFNKLFKKLGMNLTVLNVCLLVNLYGFLSIIYLTGEVYLSTFKINNKIVQFFKTKL